MEVSQPQPRDTPEAILARPWLDKFTAWKTLIRNGCPAAAGVLCLWIGFNCSFNNCPRKSFEADEFIVESSHKVETMQKQIANLKQRLTESQNQVKALKQKG